MPIFISYSQKDKSFVDTLARKLVASRHHIWMDRWELNVGDSLIDKIQSVLTTATAIVVVLSKNSIDSAWCKKELNAGLFRELEEKRVLLMPCLIEDCAIPLFLKEKLYADFRTSHDDAFDLLDRSLSRVSNFSQSRFEAPKFHTDWSVDWRVYDKSAQIDFAFVEHGAELPYVVLSRCIIHLLDSVAEKYIEIYKNEKENAKFIENVLAALISHLSAGGGSLLIQDAHEKSSQLNFALPSGEIVKAIISARRMGDDNGMDTVVRLDDTLKLALTHISDVFSSSSTANGDR